MIAYYDFPHYDYILWIKHMCFEMVKVVQMYAKKVAVRYYPPQRSLVGVINAPSSTPTATLNSWKVMFE